MRFPQVSPRKVRRMRLAKSLKPTSTSRRVGSVQALKLQKVSDMTNSQRRRLANTLKPCMCRPNHPAAKSIDGTPILSPCPINRLPTAVRRRHLLYYPRRYNLTQDKMIEWAVRRVQHVLATVKFDLHTSSVIKAGTIHKCQYCSCRCGRKEKHQVPTKTRSLDCPHCRFYPESHAGRCVGQYRERSGSLAYILRHELENEMPEVTRREVLAMAFHCMLPFSFSLIEKVRERFQAHPLGNLPMFEPIVKTQGFIASACTNGYEGYQSMLTNASSTVDPICRDEWLQWYHNQARFLASPSEYCNNKIPLPIRSGRRGARFLQYTVIETNLGTGSRFYTASPWIRMEDDVNYMRLEITSLPLDDPRPCSGRRQLGESRSFRCVGIDNVNTDTLVFWEDRDAGGYPIPTLESAPLKHFHPEQDRALYYTIQDNEKVDVSDVIPLDESSKYVKVFISTS